MEISSQMLRKFVGCHKMPEPQPLSNQERNSVLKWKDDSCACFSVGNETNQFLAPAFCFPGKMGKAKIILYVLNCFYVGGGWKGLMLIEDISGLRDIPHLPVRTQCCWHRAVVSWSPVLVLNTV